jgi:hypothetical protein
VVAFNAPEVPVTVTATGPPGVAVLLAEIVNSWLPAVVPAAKLAVTPLGNPDAARATVPANPPASATVIVLATLAVCAIDTLVGEADNVKPAGTVTVRPTPRPRHCCKSKSCWSPVCSRRLVNRCLRPANPRGC